jgi:hypothetical protein
MTFVYLADFVYPVYDFVYLADFVYPVYDLCLLAPKDF